MKTIIYARHVLSSKRIYITYIILTAYSTIAFFSRSSLYKTAALGKTEFCQLVYFNMFSIYTVTFFVIPLFLLNLELNSIVFDDYKVILKYTNIKSWWLSKVKCLVFDCLIYTLFTNLLVYFAIIICGELYRVTTDFLLFSFGLSVVHFIGYLVIGELFVVVSFISGRKYMGFLALLAINVFDYTLFQLGSEFDLLSGYIFIYGKMNLNYSNIFFIGINSFVYLCIVFVLLFVMTSKIIKNKDIEWSRKVIGN